MKKTSLVMLALCAGIPVMAQAPTVTFYGVLDAGVAHVQHSLDFADQFPVSTNPFPQKSTTGATGMFNGGLSQNRVGVKVATDLTDGWNAFLQLETAFNLTTGVVASAAQNLAQNKGAVNSTAPNTNAGNQVSAPSGIGGQLFDRGAFIGISNATYGTLSIGRQQTLLFDVMPGYDGLGLAQLFTPIGFTGAYIGGGVTEDSRVDNSVKYRVKMTDWTVAAMYKVGGVSGSTSAKSAALASVAWEPGAFGIVAVVQNFKDALGAAGNGAIVGGLPTNTISITAQDSAMTSIVSHYKGKGWMVAAGWEHVKFSNPSDPISDAGTTTFQGTVVSSVNVTPYNVAGVGEVDKTQDLYYLSANYDVTSQFNVGAGYYINKVKDYSGVPQTAVLSAKNAGNNEYASLVLDYKWTKAFDFYFGYMHAMNTGGQAV
ncbi:MAG: porin, partial [Geothrix sp.]|nr:porin [Geothrix sp.]